MNYSRMMVNPSRRYRYEYNYSYDSKWRKTSSKERYDPRAWKPSSNMCSNFVYDGKTVTYDLDAFYMSLSHLYHIKEVYLDNNLQKMKSYTKYYSHNDAICETKEYEYDDLERLIGYVYYTEGGEIKEEKKNFTYTGNEVTYSFNDKWYKDIYLDESYTKKKKELFYTEKEMLTEYKRTEYLYDEQKREIGYEVYDKGELIIKSKDYIYDETNKSLTYCIDLLYLRGMVEEVEIYYY